MNEIRFSDSSKVSKELTKKKKRKRDLIMKWIQNHSPEKNLKGLSYLSLLCLFYHLRNKKPRMIKEFAKVTKSIRGRT